LWILLTYDHTKWLEAEIRLLEFPLWKKNNSCSSSPKKNVLRTFWWRIRFPRWRKSEMTKEPTEISGSSGWLPQKASLQDKWNWWRATLNREWP
jgi:hypothetical protein